MVRKYTYRVKISTHHAGLDTDRAALARSLIVESTPSSECGDAKHGDALSTFARLAPEELAAGARSRRRGVSTEKSSILEAPREETYGRIVSIQNRNRGHVVTSSVIFGARRLTYVALLAGLLVLPDLAFAQASPFLTGANSLQTNILAWATPIAIILVMVLGVMAMANRISWAWPIAAIVGIAIVFGAPQIVTWIRGMFGV